jgi:RimJ/RimL family protein N-acetyltransferase
MRHWPLSELCLTTPRLRLRLPDPSELNELADVAVAGIHDPAVMPFGEPWTDADPEALGRSVLQHHWLLLSRLRLDAWDVPFVVFLKDRAVGTQLLSGQDFDVTRQVSTGSWLGREFQARGLGTEMRAAVLHLAFVALGAESATTNAHSDNAASLGVARKIGYRPNGTAYKVVRGVRVTEQRFVLDREGWERHRTVPVEISGLQACVSMLTGRAPSERSFYDRLTP